VKCYYGVMLCPVIAQLTENKTAHGCFGQYNVDDDVDGMRLHL
jgi:hypothetical protein